MTNAITKLNDRMLTGAINYAAYDKSDPFALMRAISHIKNGVASVNNNKQNPAYYDATPYEGTKIVSHGGKEVKIKTTLYRDMVRP